MAGNERGSVIYGIRTTGGQETIGQFQSVQRAIEATALAQEKLNKALDTGNKLWKGNVGPQRSIYSGSGAKDIETVNDALSRQITWQEKLNSSLNKNNLTYNGILQNLSNIESLTTGKVIPAQEKSNQVTIKGINALDTMVGKFVLYAQAILYAQMIIQAYSDTHKKMIDAAVKGEEQLDEKYRTLTSAINEQKKATEELNEARGDLLKEDQTKAMQAQAAAALATASAIERQRDAMQGLLDFKNQFGEFWYELWHSPANTTGGLPGANLAAQYDVNSIVYGLQQKLGMGNGSPAPSAVNVEQAVSAFFEQNPQYNRYSGYVAHEIVSRWNGSGALMTGPSPAGGSPSGQYWDSANGNYLMVPKSGGSVTMPLDAPLGLGGLHLQDDGLRIPDSSAVVGAGVASSPELSAVATAVSGLSVLHMDKSRSLYRRQEDEAYGRSAIFGAIDAYRTTHPNWRADIAGAVSGGGYWVAQYDAQRGKRNGGERQTHPYDFAIFGDAARTLTQQAPGSPLNAAYQTPAAAYSPWANLATMRGPIGTAQAFRMFHAGQGVYGGILGAGRYQRYLRGHSPFDMDVINGDFQYGGFGDDELSSTWNASSGYVWDYNGERRKARQRQYRQNAYGAAGAFASGGFGAAASFGLDLLAPGLGSIGLPLVGKLFGGLFGGGKHKDIGMTPSNPVWTRNEVLEQQNRDLLNILVPTLSSSAAGRVQALFNQAAQQGVVTRTAMTVRAV